MSSLSSQSSKLLEPELMSEGSLGPIRESKTLIKQRKVICWTPVLIGNTNLPSNIQKQVLNYKTGDYLHS